MKLTFNSNAQQEDREPAGQGNYLILNSDGFENTATSGKTALMVAVLAKNERMVRHMLSHGFDPNAQDGIGNTALMYAILADTRNLCDMLVKGGANLWITNHKNETALQIAENLGRHEMAEFLRNFETDKNGRTNVSLLEETLAEGYVIAVNSKSHGIVPVIAVGPENTEIIAIDSIGQDIMIQLLDCVEELTIKSDEFERKFSPAQRKRLLAA